MNYKRLDITKGKINLARIYIRIVEIKSIISREHHLQELELIQERYNFRTYQQSIELAHQTQQLFLRSTMDLRFLLYHTVVLNWKIRCIVKTQPQIFFHCNKEEHKQLFVALFFWFTFVVESVSYFMSHYNTYRAVVKISRITKTYFNKFWRVMKQACLTLICSHVFYCWRYLLGESFVEERRLQYASRKCLKEYIYIINLEI